jgi:hypothetical protein
MSTNYVELHDGKVINVSKIIVLDKVFKNGTTSTLDLVYDYEHSLELCGTEAELLADYEVIKRAMLGTGLTKQQIKFMPTLSGDITFTPLKFDVGDIVLTQRPQESPIPHDQPMHGRCFTCGAVVECKFSDCKVVDDPPLGRVATVACPSKKLLTEQTPEGIKAFAAYKECGAVVRMAQTRGDK